MSHGITAVAFPRVGKVARQRRMRAKQASVQSNAAYHPFVRVPGGWNALRGAFKQRRSRLLAPRLGGGVRLRGAVWLHRSPLHPVCRFAQDDTWGTGAWDGGLTVGVGGMRYVGALACFALIRHWRATFPTRGKAFSGIPLLHVIPLYKRDPACWRPAWGGVRCAAMIGGCA